MNKQRPQRRLFLATSLLLFALAAILVGVTWQRVRQQQRNRQLIVAIKRGDAQTAIALLEQGADANAHDTPLQHTPFWTLMLDTLRGRRTASAWGTPVLLLALGGEETGTTFRFSCTNNLPLIKALVAHGAKIDEQTPFYGWSALIIAAWSNQREVTQYLVEHHANLNLKNRDNFTALALAPRVVGKKGMDWSNMKVFMLLKRAGAQQ